MSWYEFVNSTSTVAGSAIGAGVGTLAGKALHNDGAGAVLSFGLGLAGAYAGNLVNNMPDPKRVRRLVHDKVAVRLTAAGMTKDQIEEAFQHYNPTEPIPRPSVLTNIGNIFTTGLVAAVVAPIGLLATTSLATASGKGLDLLIGGNKVASYGFVGGMLTGGTIGSVAGGYLGNMVFRGPGKKYIESETGTFVQQVLAERSQVTAGVQRAV